MNKVIDFNHISDKVSNEQVTELKAYYTSYHKRQWCYNAAFKRLRKWKLGDISSVIFATGGIAPAVATSGVSLVAISAVSVLIQSYMKHKDAYQCQYAFQTYRHPLNETKNVLRSGEFDSQEFYSKMIYLILSPINNLILFQYCS